MSIEFPSSEFFLALKERLAADPPRSEQLEPSDAYCGFAIDDQLFVLEFEGLTCAAVVRGGNELDLDFVVAGPEKAWRRTVEAAAAGDLSGSLSVMLEQGELEVRSHASDGPTLAQAALPLLQVFLEGARDLDPA